MKFFHGRRTSCQAILTSCQEEQFSYEGAPFHNGYFTHFLLEALHRNDGMNTNQQNYDYVKGRLPRAVAARIQVSRGVHLKNDSRAAAFQPATQVSAPSSSEFGGEIILGEPTAFP